MTKASFWRRVGAFAIDAAAYYVVWGLLSLVGFAFGSTPAHVQDLTYWPGLALYFIGFWSMGATPGMRTMRIDLRREDERPGILRAAVRFAVLGGAAALSVATVIIAFAPYLVVCAFGLYPHDLIAGTHVVHVGSGEVEVHAGKRASAWILALVRGFFALMVIGVVLGIALGGFGDSSYTAWVRNDGSDALTMSYAFDAANETRSGTLRPGEVTDFTRIGGGRESPRLRLRGFDSAGVVVFCREYSYDDYRASTRTNPVLIREGQLSCR